MTTAGHEGEPRLTIEIITPARAAELLTLNHDNRKLRASIVATYRRDMEAGRWALTGEPIVVNGQRLLNGQHRLNACVEAGVPFRTAVMYDAGEDIHYAIDRGVKRTTGDEFGWRGEKNVNQLAAACSLAWRYYHDVLFNPAFQPSAAELVEFLAEHPELRAATAMGQRVKKAGVLVSAWAVTTALVIHYWSQEEAEELTDRVDTGVGLLAGDPALALRQYAISVRGTTRVRPRREEWLAVCNKTANAYLQRRPLKLLKLTRAEEFPWLVTPQPKPRKRRG